MKRMLFLLLLAGCAAGRPEPRPDPRPEFSARNVGRTVVTFDDDAGTQAVYLAPDGTLHLWNSAGAGVQRGLWRYQPTVDEAAATYQATAGINYPAEELATGWRLCFRLDAGPEDGDWSCTPLNDYEALVVDRADDDVLGLVAGTPPGSMPAKRRMGIAALRAL